MPPVIPERGSLHTGTRRDPTSGVGVAAGGTGSGSKLRL